MSVEVRESSQLCAIKITKANEIKIKIFNELSFHCECKNISVGVSLSKVKIITPSKSIQN